MPEITDNKQILSESSKILLQRIDYICKKYDIPPEVLMLDFCFLLTTTYAEDFTQLLDEFLRKLYNGELKTHLEIMKMIKTYYEKETK